MGCGLDHLETVCCTMATSLIRDDIISYLWEILACMHRKTGIEVRGMEVLGPQKELFRFYQMAHDDKGR